MYGSIFDLHARLARSGFDKPFLLTECVSAGLATDATER